MVQEDSLSQRQINSAKKIIKQVAMLNSPSSMEVNVKESSVKEVEPQPPNIDNNRSISPKGPPDKKLSNNKRNKKSWLIVVVACIFVVLQLFLDAAGVGVIGLRSLAVLVAWGTLVLLLTVVFLCYKLEVDWWFVCIVSCCRSLVVGLNQPFLGYSLRYEHVALGLFSRMFLCC
ncbi:hypothetical protein U1Q18_052235 [Sarracenia purpurea var. burkii]